LGKGTGSKREHAKVVRVREKKDELGTLRSIRNKNEPLNWKKENELENGKCTLRRER